MAQRIVTDVSGKKYIRQWEPGPKPRGFVRVLVDVPAEHLAVMQYRRDQCGGTGLMFLSVFSGGLLMSAASNASR